TGAGAGAGAAGGGEAPGAGDPPRIKSAGLRLTFEVTLPGGPTGGATAAPTVTLRASGLPALSKGAVAVVGTVNDCPWFIMPSNRVLPWSVTWIHAGAIAVSTTGPWADAAGAAAAARCGRARGIG